MNMTMLQQAALDVTGFGLPEAAQRIDLDSLLSVAAIIDSRHESGGCSPQSVRAEIASLRELTATDRSWFNQRREYEQSAIAALVERAEELSSS
jgi:hypothetical protein